MLFILMTVSSRLFDTRNPPLKTAPQAAPPEGLPPPSLLQATLMLIILHNQASPPTVAIIHTRRTPAFLPHDPLWLLGPRRRALRPRADHRSESPREFLMSSSERPYRWWWILATRVPIWTTTLK